MIEQHILRYENLQNLKNVDVAKFLKKYINFVEKRIESQNAKNRQIFNFMKKKWKKWNNKNKRQEKKIKYIEQKNMKKKINKYDFINNNNKFDDEIEIVKISND